MTQIRRSLAVVLGAVALISMPGLARAGTVLDPIGDTFSGGPDIISVTTAVEDGSVQFTMNFAAAIAPPSAFDVTNSVIGFIDLDTDQNAATGVMAVVNAFSPPPAVALGDEFVVRLEDEASNPGFVGVYSASVGFVGAVPIAFAASAFSVSIPLTLLGGDDGLLNFGAIIGNFFVPTDRVPNGETPLSTAAVPEPASLLLLGFGLAGWAGHAWWLGRRPSEFQRVRATSLRANVRRELAGP